MGFVRRNLSADGLHCIVRNCIKREGLVEKFRSNISWQDCIMSGLAIFGLKFPSLLQFENSQYEPFIRRNLKNLYQIQRVPSDTYMRERLDELSANHFRRPFKAILSYLQRGKVLECYRYLGNHYLISLDGTGQYSSDKVHCKNCCEKHHRTEDITYYHHMLGAVIVHPDEEVVIPLAPEPIVKSDGDNKNDCERNAAKRLLNDFRREHPHLKAIVIEDGLGSNYPHLSLLDSLNLQYIIGVKNGDHGFLFDWIKHADGNEVSYKKDKINHKFRYVNNVPLNDEHFDYRVNVLEYWEEKPNGKSRYFSWVSSFKITDENVFELMRAGRARWKIENETFNTLKNQGYNFEHNYGHGYNNLCSVMTMLMLLAFFIDQVQQLCCKLYQKARKKVGSLVEFFLRKRFLFEMAVWNCWQDIYETILSPSIRPPPIGILPPEND